MLQTSMGKKLLMAITGFYLLLFVIVHLLGNLEIFAGPDAINQYSAFLKTIPKLLWSLRITLIIAVITHIWLSISLTRENSLARKEKYIYKKSKVATLASRTMILSGLTIFFFVIYHLAHYTFGIVDPDLMKLIDHEGRHHVYNMIVSGFSHPLVSGFYILAITFLSLHLSHGISSAARTLGVADKNIYARIILSGQIFAIGIAILYISIPLSVLFGLLEPDF